MEKLVRINQKIIGKPDRVTEYLIKNYAIREYNQNGSWSSSKPFYPPEGTRLVFNLEDFRECRDVNSLWRYINAASVHKPVRADAITERMLNSRSTNNPLTLFVPWGVRPQGNIGQNELAVLEILGEIRDIFYSRKVPSEIMLMPADLYATEVNKQVSSEITATYFAAISELAKQRGFKVVPWSQIRDENYETYSSIQNKMKDIALIDRLSPAKVDNAIQAARRRSGLAKEGDIKNAAFRYLRERICEALIVEEVYKPVKLSTVGKNKDGEIDQELPRLYFIPENLQFPWLK